jgi:hypothetical protein
MYLQMIKGLIAATSYQFRICAENRLGRSHWSLPSRLVRVAKLMITCCSKFLVLVTCFLAFCMLYVWVVCDIIFVFVLVHCSIFPVECVAWDVLDMNPFILVNILFRRQNWSTDCPRPSRPRKCAKYSSTRSKYAGSPATRPLSELRAASCRCRCQEAERYTFCF